MSPDDLARWAQRLPPLLIFFGLGLLLLVALLGFVPLILSLALPAGLLMIALGVAWLGFPRRSRR